MPSTLRRTPPTAIVTGWDFSTGGVKCVAFDTTGAVVAEVRLSTDLWTDGGVTELNLMQLEGQARASTRAMAAKLRDLGRLADWVCGGISATHHSAGRIDAHGNQVRRAICWNDQTLAEFHAAGLARLGGMDRVKELIGGPWAERYSLSHLVKDERTLSAADWARTKWMLPHGPLAGGYLTGRFDACSVSSAASTGLLDLRTNQWQREMLDALEHPANRESAWTNLPPIVDMNDPLGPLAEHVALDAGLPPNVRPLVFPTLDDQAAGLIGGGAVEPGQVAIILGNSAVVNSSAGAAPVSGSLDAMKLNWGPYLWMRCHSNGAKYLNHVVGANPDWTAINAAARTVPPGCGGTTVSPDGWDGLKPQWSPAEPTEIGAKVRAVFECLAYRMGLGFREHEAAGQKVTRVTISGGIAQSDLMCEIVATVLGRSLERLVSSEGPALGAATAALAGYETHLRRANGDMEPFTATDAVAAVVKYRSPVTPRADWAAAYRRGLAAFEESLGERPA